MKRYKNIEVDYGVNAEIMENYEREQERLRMEEEMARANAENFDMEAEQDGDLDALDTEEVFGEQVYETPGMIEAGEIAEFVELD